MPDPKHVAAIVTEYRRWSHADVIVGKILEGFYHDGKSLSQPSPGVDVRRSNARQRHEPRSRHEIQIPHRQNH